MAHHSASVLRSLRCACIGLALLGVTGCDDGDGQGRAGAGEAGGKTDCYGYECEAEAGGPLAEAFCFAEVEGVGTVDVETEYLANVIFCENGGADIEALKAMAIAARSVLYWEMGVNGSICDSQSCQVFTCDGEPSEIHYRAVEETSGQYLYFEDQVTYGFYVRGETQAADGSCTLPEGEQWVTYNEGLQGLDVIQTELGWVSDPSEPAYGQNRGCMSQLGMQCLETAQGFDYIDILRFYYGADINVAQAQGECILSLYGDDEPAATGTGGDAPSTTGDGGGTTTGFDPDSDSGDGSSSSDSGTDPDGKPRPQDDSASGSSSGTDSAGSTTGTDPETTTKGDETATGGADTDGPRGDDTDGGTDGSDPDGGGTDGYPDDPYDDSGADDDDGYPVPDGDSDDTRGTPGNGTSPWGDGGDTDTDGGSEINSEESGCQIGDRNNRGGQMVMLLGLGLLGWHRRRG